MFLIRRLGGQHGLDHTPLPEPAECEHIMLGSEAIARELAKQGEVVR